MFKIIINTFFVLLLFSLASAIMFYSGDQSIHLALLIAFALMFYGYRGVLPYERAKDWVKGTAILLEYKEMSEVIPGDESRTEYFFPLVWYEYRFNGEKHTGSQVSFEKENVWTANQTYWGGAQPESYKPWHAWEVGRIMDVYINPKKPEESVLMPTLSKARKSHHLAVTTAGAFVFILWILLVIYSPVRG
ncbi:MAG TPA: DUF3592 domain-containing protein [Hyphomicrobiales bacterium]|nr:DUF3592 domain-containing protein [Hyphomicrobiales bacterium]